MWIIIGSVVEEGKGPLLRHRGVSRGVRRRDETLAESRLGWESTERVRVHTRCLDRDPTPVISRTRSPLLEGSLLEYRGKQVVSGVSYLNTFPVPCGTGLEP